MNKKVYMKYLVSVRTLLAVPANSVSETVMFVVALEDLKGQYPRFHVVRDEYAAVLLVRFVSGNVSPFVAHSAGLHAVFASLFANFDDLRK